MSVRTQDLESIAPVLASFSISQSGDVDTLKDANIGQPVTITANNEIGPIGAGELLLGKLISLSLTDHDDGQRVATVQIGGTCRLAVSATVPVVGDRVVGGTAGTVKQAPGGTVTAGANIGRGVVLEVNGSINCLVYLG